MTYIVKPKFHHPSLPKNALGYTHRDYEGSVSTLCAGCGHDSISGALIEACFELDIEPHRVAKLSGIGCSSKTPTYFLGNSHGFNSVHGRMPSVLTVANLANRELIYLGVSGDGDSASIGLGQFAHALRRALQQVFALEQHFAIRDAPGRLRNEAHDRQRSHALAAARLADDAERAAALELELAEPAYGVAPGQTACLMAGDLVVGQATIA